MVQKTTITPEKKHINPSKRGTFKISYIEGPIQPAPSWYQASQDEHGAVSTFIGTVRNTNHGREVTKLNYSIEQNFSTLALAEICKETEEKFGVSDIEIIHSHGELNIGDISVYIKVSTKHRHEAFQICEYVIEQLKIRATIWKKEFYTDGETEWLKGHALCRH